MKIWMLQFIINEQVFLFWHRNLKSQNFNYNNASFIFDNEGHYNGLWKYYISFAPSQNFHLLSLFKNKHLGELKFPTLFYGQLQQFLEGFLCQ
jgi:hypothetical protein